MNSMNLRKVKSGSALFDPKIVWPAVGAAFAKLDPRLQIKNPVMFVVEVVAALTTLIFIRDLFTGADQSQLHLSNHSVALDHGVVCELCRSGRGRPRQGAGSCVCGKRGRSFSPS